MGRVLGFLFFLIFAGLGAFVSLKIYEFSILNVSDHEEKIRIDVPPGSNLSILRRELEKNGISIDPFVWRIWARFRANPQKLRVGEFETSKRNSQMGILEDLLESAPITYRLTLKEGNNIFNFIEEAEKLPISKEALEKLKKSLFNSQLAEKLGAPGRSDPPLTLEGFLFPNTYFFQKYDSAETILGALTGQYQKQIEPLLSEHPWGKTPEGRYRLLTLASIVEKESGIFEEQPLIASVFWNRLKKGMRLQSDPTIIYWYLLEENRNIEGFNIRKFHLTTPTPFNTYTIPELPVGPIANPGLSAVKAVLNPATTSYLYFVSKGDGSHVFATNLKDHNTNVNIYQKKIKPKAPEKTSMKFISPKKSPSKSLRNFQPSEKKVSRSSKSQGPQG